MISRRSFNRLAAGYAAAELLTHCGPVARPVHAADRTQPIPGPLPGEDVEAFLTRVHGQFDTTQYARILGAANEFKEGDAAIGVAAADEVSRRHARTLLENTPLSRIDARPLINDELTTLITDNLSPRQRDPSQPQTLGQLKRFLLTANEADIKAVMPSLSSRVIGCVVKLMSNNDLINVGRAVFNPLPGGKIGAQGYLGARVQPNSPTDNVDDIRWQVFSGWSFAVGDALLGTNPVSSEPASVAAIERTLKDLVVTLGAGGLPHCVLSHIDVQAQVEEQYPGSTALWFQSIAGTDSANATFDISIEKMQKYASQRTGKFGLYFETGQGADFTNGHGHGFDMVLHESRKYGFARALTRTIASAQRRSGHAVAPWVHLNDVAGFIGPEVFRTREQLVRCCLEDIAMGKLHGLCLGLDVCSTLHMDVSLDDLDWCLDRIMPANPAYLMALPTKIDPMLGYLTTGFQDHVRLREKFGYRVDDAAWKFFQRLGVIDDNGKPTDHFGDPVWVCLQYHRRRGDRRPDREIIEDARQQLAEVRSRGVFIAEGYGAETWELKPSLKADIRRIYDEAKESIWAQLDQETVDRIPAAVPLATRSKDRLDYILHPESGEELAEKAQTSLQTLRQRHAGQYDIQIVISDGLNALAISDTDQLDPFLRDLRAHLTDAGFTVAPEHIVVTSGRVRCGYRIGEMLFANLPGQRSVLHIIGERPGTGHRTFSNYMTAPTGGVWAELDKVDHNITRVVSGIANTALKPAVGANDSVRILKTMIEADA